MPDYSISAPEYYYNEIQGSPLAAGTATGSVSTSDTPTSSVGGASGGYYGGPTANGYSYHTPVGVFRSTYSAPQVLDYELGPSDEVVLASAFVPEFAGQTTAISNIAVEFFAPESYMVTYDASVAGNVEGTMTISSEFSPDGPPKFTASYEPVAGSLLTAQLVWKVLTAGHYMLASNELDETSTVYYGTGSLTQQTGWTDAYVQFGDNTDPQQWTTRGTLSWQDYGSGELWIGNVVIDFNHQGPGIEVRFPTGETTIDPTMYARGPGSGLQYQSERKAFYSAGHYWSFWADRREIFFSKSVDGASWDDISPIGAENLPDGGAFDVAYYGGTLAVAWFDTTAWNVRVRVGSVLPGQIEWDGDSELIDWSAYIVGLNQANALTPPTIAITTDGYVYVAARAETSPVPTNVVMRSVGPYSPIISEIVWSCDQTNCPDPRTDLTTELVAGLDGGLTVLMAPSRWAPNPSRFYWATYAPTASPSWSSPTYQNYLDTNSADCLDEDGLAAQRFTAALSKSGSTGVVLKGSDGSLKYFEVDSSGVVAGPETVVTPSGGIVPIHPSLGIDPVGHSHLVWLSRNCGYDGSGHLISIDDDVFYSKRHTLASGSAQWTAPRSLQTSSSASGLSSPHVPASVFPALLVTWRGPVTNGVADILGRTVQLPLSSAAFAGHAWSGQGLSSFGSYVNEMGYSVSSTSGQLMYRTVEVDIPARGLDLTLTRTYESPQYFSSESGQVRPYLHEGNPYVWMGEGWGLEFPWASDTFFYLPGGAQILYSWGSDAKFESRAGVAFQATYSIPTSGPQIELSFSSGVKMILSKIGGAFLVTRAWNGLSYTSSNAPNVVMFEYYGSGGAAPNRLERITDPTQRTLTFGYAAGLLTSITYKSTPTDAAHTVSTYGYYASGSSVGQLMWAEDANGQRESYEYATTPAPTYLLNKITFRQGGFAALGYHDAVTVGTDAHTYPVNLVNLYGLQDVWEPPSWTTNAILAHTTRIDTDFVNGIIYHTKVTNGDNQASVKAISDFTVSPRRGYSVGIDRDADGNILRKNVAWFDVTGALWKVDRYVGSAAIPYATEYAGFDDNGNPAYSRDTNGFEIFSSYLNTGSESTYRGAARIDYTSGMGGLVERFDHGDGTYWSLSEGCPASGCLVWDDYFFDPPALRVYDDTAQFAENSAIRSIGMSISEPYVTAVFKIRSPSFAQYSLALRDQSSSKIAFKLTLEANFDAQGNPGQFRARWVDSEGGLNTPAPYPDVSFVMSEWHKITIWRQQTTYFVFVDDALVLQGSAFDSTVTSIDAIEVIARRGSGSPDADLLLNELTVGIDGVVGDGQGGHSQSFEVSGLPTGSKVFLIDPVGGIVDRASVIGTGYVEMEGLRLNSTAQLIVISESGQLVFGGPISGSGRIDMHFTPPASLSPISLASSGFANMGRVHVAMVNDQPCPSGSPEVCSSEPSQYFYVDDDPIGAVTGGTYHQSKNAGGAHRHGFNAGLYYSGEGSPTVWTVPSGSYMQQYVYVPHGARPTEVMVGYYVQNMNPWVAGTWTTASWGTDSIDSGADWPFDSKLRASDDAPSEGHWVQLLVKASDLGLEGEDIAGIMYAVDGGTARWDLSAIATPGAAGITISNLDPGMTVQFEGEHTTMAWASFTDSWDYTAFLDLYEAGYRMFPIDGTISVFDSGGDLVSSVPVTNVMGGDQYAFNRWDFYPAPAVTRPPEEMRNLQAGSISWASGREILSLDTGALIHSTDDESAVDGILDVSGNGHNAVVYGFDGLTTDGHGNGGQAAYADYGLQIRVPTFYDEEPLYYNTAALRVPSDMLSLSVRFRLDASVPTTTGLISYGIPRSDFSGGPWYMILYPTVVNGVQLQKVMLYISLLDGTTGVSVVLDSPENSVSVGNWHQAGFTFGHNAVTLYLDGIAVDRFDDFTSEAGISTQLSSHYLYIAEGPSTVVPGGLFGAIDDVKLFDHAIMESEMEQLASAQETTARQVYTDYWSSGLVRSVKNQIIEGGSVGGLGFSQWVEKGFTYDTYGNLVSATDGLGMTTTFSYYSTPAPAHTYPISVQRVAYDNAVNPPLFTIATETFGYDIWGRITSYISPKSLRTDFTYENDATGSPIANGRLTKIEYPVYSGNDQTLQGTRPTETWAYLDPARKVIHTPPSSTYSDQVQYDGLGRPRYENLVWAPCSGCTGYYWSSQYSYDFWGHVTANERTYERLSQAGDESERIVREHDALGRLVALVQPPGTTSAPRVEYVYDNTGSIGGEPAGSAPTVKVVDEEGRWTIYRFGVDGRLRDTCQWADRQAETNCFSSAESEIVEVRHNLAGEKVWQRDAENGVSSWAYDQFGRVARIWSPNPATGKTTVRYDRDTSYYVLTVSVQVDGFSLPVRTNRIDALGRVFYSTSFDGYETSHVFRGFDADGNLIRSEQPPVGYKDEYWYNSWGQVVKKKTTPFGGTAKQVDLSYDGAMRLSGIKYPDQSYIGYEYDTFDRIRAITSSWSDVQDPYDQDPNDQDELVLILYNRNHEVDTRWILRSTHIGWFQQQWSPFDSPQDSYTGDWGTGEFLVYAHNDAGDLTSIADPSQTFSTSYEYDEMRRLTKVTPSAAGSTEFSYDGNGNRVSVSDNSGTGTTTGYSYETGDLLTTISRSGDSSYPRQRQYDEFGRLYEIIETDGNSWGYEYSPGGQLKQVRTGTTGSNRDTWNQEAAYWYGPEGDLLSASEGTTGTNYFTLGGRVIYSWPSVGPGARTYAYDPKGLVAIHDESGNTYIPFQDPLDNILRISDKSMNVVWQASYSPFGVATLGSGNTIQNEFGFVANGLHPDAGPAGLGFFNARWYDPENGRFISRDPMGGSPAAPATLNPYSYALNNPMTYTDPTGLCVFLVGCVIGGMVLGVVLGLIVTFVGAPAYEWFTQEASWQEQRGFVAGVALAVLVGLSCVYALCSGLALLGGTAIAAAGGYLAVTAALGGTPTLEGLMHTVGIGMIAGGAAFTAGRMLMTATQVAGREASIAAANVNYLENTYIYRATGIGRGPLGPTKLGKDLERGGVSFFESPTQFVTSAKYYHGISLKQIREAGGRYMFDGGMTKPGGGFYPPGHVSVTPKPGVPVERFLEDLARVLDSPVGDLLEWGWIP